MSPNRRSTPAKPLRVALAGAAGFLMILLLTAGAKGCRDLDVVHQREALLGQRVHRTQIEIERLERRVTLLKEDPMTLERMAREELGMVRPKDVVIVLPEN